MNVVFVVAPSEEVSLDRPLACDAVDSARPVSVPQDPLAAGCQTKVCGTCTAVLPDVSWQLSCLEYGLEQRVDGRLVCVDGAVVRDCPRSLLLGDDAALIAACVELLFGTCAVTGREHVHAANGIAGAAETAYVEDDMAARRDVAHSHARLCKTQHGYVKKDPAYLAGRHRGVHGFCMQKAVLSCCHGDVRRRMRARFAAACRDSGGSGLSGTFTDACNLAAVGVGVLLEGVWLWVVGRAPGVSRSWMRWKLGDEHGANIGVVAWMTQRQHAVKLIGRDVGSLVEHLADGDPAQAPWWTSVVGAPKKQKKRGCLANLKQFAKRTEETALPHDDGVAEPSTGGAACSVEETTASVSGRPACVEPVMTRSRALIASVSTAMEVVHPPSGVGEQVEVPGVAVDDCWGEDDSLGDPPTSTDEESVGAAPRSPPSPGAPPSQSSLGNPPSLSSLGEPPSSIGPPSYAGSLGDECSMDDPPSSSIGEPDSDEDMSATRKRGRRHLRAGAGADVIAEVTEEMSKEFGTLENTEKCRARTWGGGSGVQCPCRPLTGSEFCGRHGNDRWKAHGRVDEVMSVELYQKFIRYRERVPQGKAPAPRKHYYTRHHMWSAAVAVRGAGTNGLGPLENLEELTNEERRVALEKCRRL